MSESNVTYEDLNMHVCMVSKICMFIIFLTMDLNNLMIIIWGEFGEFLEQWWKKFQHSDTRHDEKHSLEKKSSKHM